jgi:hypothetical protein
MGSENSIIRDSIQSIVNSQNKSKNIFFFGEVTEIDDVNNTFTIKNVKGDSFDEITGVKVNFGEKTIIGGNTFVTMPNIGSQVIVLKNYDDNSYYLFKFEELSKYAVATKPTTPGAADDYILFSTQNFEVNSGKVNLYALDSIGLLSDDLIQIFASDKVSIQADNDGIELITGTFNVSTQNLGGLVKVIDVTSQLNKIELKVNAILTALIGLGITIPPLVPTVRADIENTGIVQYKNI